MGHTLSNTPQTLHFCACEDRNLGLRTFKFTSYRLGVNLDRRREMTGQLGKLNWGVIGRGGRQGEY